VKGLIFHGKNAATVEARVRVRLKLFNETQGAFRDRSMELKKIKLLSVGIDVGSATSHLVFSNLVLVRDEMSPHSGSTSRKEM